MSTGVHRSARRDGGRVEAIAQDDDSWTWTVIFTVTMLCALSFAALFSIAIELMVQIVAIALRCDGSRTMSSG